MCLGERLDFGEENIKRIEKVAYSRYSNFHCLPVIFLDDKINWKNGEKSVGIRMSQNHTLQFVEFILRTIKTIGYK